MSDKIMIKKLVFKWLKENIFYNDFITHLTISPALILDDKQDLRRHFYGKIICNKFIFSYNSGL